MSPIDASLQLYNLGYDMQRMVLYCTSCKGIMSKNAVGHLRKVHKVRKISLELREVLSQLEIHPLDLDTSRRRERLPYLAVINGFQCNTCDWCSSSVGSMRKHISQMNHLDSGYHQQLVQKGGAKSGSKLFPVFESTAAQHNEENVDVERVVGQATSFLNFLRTPVETFRTKDMFYTQMFWFVEEHEEMFLDSIRIWEYFDCPTSFRHGEEIHSWLCELIEGVRQWDINTRMDLGRTDINQPFRVLHRSKSVQEYAKLFSKVLFFVLNLIERPAEGLFENLRSFMGGEIRCPSEAITRASNQFRESFSREDFLNVLELITQEKLTISRVNDGKTVLSLFVRLYCRRREGHLLKPDEVSRFTAKLIYLIKLVYGQCLLNSASQDRYESERRYCYDIRGRSVFSFVVLVNGQAQKYAKQANPLPKIVELDSGRRILLSGLEVNIPRYRNGYLDAEDELIRRLDVLVFGLAEPVLRTEQFRDDISCDSVGYTMHFVDAMAGKEANGLLIRHILQTRDLKEKFVQSTNGGAIEWKRAAVEDYIKRYDMFIELWVLIIHVISGMPGRATELATLTLRNGQSGLRSFYLMDGVIGMRTLYSKTSNMTGTVKAILRFLNPRGTGAFLRDFFLVRPLVTIMAESIGWNIGNVYSQYFFLHSGKPYDGEDIRVAFNYYFAEFCGCGLTFGAYRHLAKYIANHSPTSPVTIDDESSDSELE